MKVVVRKWGNSAAVRLPAAVMRAANLRIDQPVAVSEEAGRIVIEPICPPTYDLAGLIAAMTDENRHDPVDMGPMVGHEIW